MKLFLQGLAIIGFIVFLGIIVVSSNSYDKKRCHQMYANARDAHDSLIVDAASPSRGTLCLDVK